MTCRTSPPANTDWLPWESEGEMYGPRVGEDEETFDGPMRCPSCNGLISDDGYTIDPDKCCHYCKAD